MTSTERVARTGAEADAGAEACDWRGEAERWRAEAERSRRRVAELEGQVAALAEKVTTLSRMLFGDRSEKKKPASAGEENPGSRPGPGGGGPGRRRRGQQRGSPGHGRRDYTHLPTEEQVHDVPANERVCSRCGKDYESFGEECSEQIDWQVRLVRIVHRRRTYRRSCRCEDVPGVIAARRPARPTPKGRFSGGFLARLLVEKYVLGRPLHRIVAALGYDGLDVAEGSLVGTLRTVSGLLEPLEAAIRERNAIAAHQHIDETSWRVFEPVEGKANNRWWLWVFLAADTTVFRIERSRSTAVLREHFGLDEDAEALPGGRRLLISADFWTAYQSLSKVSGVDPLWCWAHIRRYFLRAGEAGPELAGWADQWVTGRIGGLYLAHTALAAAEAGTEAYTRAQQGFEEAIERIDTARREQAADPDLPERARKVLATLDREWDGLARHREFGELDLDNNRAERAIRGPVVGRKNYYGSGAVWAARLAGRAWTITATAAHAGASPLAYLTDYFSACAAAGGKAPAGPALDRFLPWVAGGEDLAGWRAPPGGPAP